MRADNKSTRATRMKTRSWGKGAALLVSAMFFLLFVPAAQAADVYKVTMTRTGTMGLTTDCDVEGYILAHGDSKGLVANGSDLEPNGDLGPELQLNIGSDVAWTRKYEADPNKGLSGVFDGCFGETSGPNGFHGGLHINFANGKGPNGKSTVSFTWHFDYYVTPGNTIREHFTLKSGSIPFPVWTGGNLSGPVNGTYDLAYYLKEGRKIISSYESLTGGQGRQFEFVLTIEKVQ